MSYPSPSTPRRSSDLTTRYQRMSSQQQQQQQQQQYQQQRPQSQRRTYSASTPTWTSQPVPEPPLLPPLVDHANWIATLPPIQQWPSMLVERLLLAPISVLLTATRDIILSPRTHRIVVRLGVLATIFWIGLALAVFSYIGFYRAWVPDVGLRKEIWLQYGHDRPPYAYLDFHPGHENPPREPNPSSSSYNPSTEITGEFFAQDQAYDVTLELAVPLNQANLDLGNFMVDLDLKTKSNRSVFHVSKPTLLTYSAAPVRAVSMVSELLSGNPPETPAPSDSKLLRIQLLKRAILRPSSYTPPLASTPPDPRADKKVTHGHVSVGRADADKYWMYGANHHTLIGLPTAGDSNTQGRIMPVPVPMGVGAHTSRGELQTYSASLRFDAHLTGLRFFMYHFPLLSFFTFTTLFMAFEMVTALTLWAVAAIWTSTMTVGDNGLGADEHFQQQRREKGYGESERMKDEGEGETTTSAEEALGYRGREEYASDDEETETETEGRRRGQVKRESDEGGLPRVKREEYDDFGDEEEEMRLRSLESLREKDEADLLEAMRQSRMREILEARRMGGAGPSSVGLMSGTESLIDIVDPTSPISPEELSEMQLSRRALHRLDEETEEDTDVGGSLSSRSEAGRRVQGGAGGGGGESDPWEDLEASAEEQAEASGIRQRRKHADDEDDDEDAGEGTIGGSTTSGTRTARSFGATTAAGSASTRTTHPQ